MATVMEPVGGHHHQRIRRSAIIGLTGAILFVPALFAFLLVRLLICQGNEHDLGNLMMLCPIVNYLVPSLALLLPIAVLLILLELHSLGEGAEAEVHHRYAAARAAQASWMPPPVAAVQEAMASTGARIAEGHQRLDDTHKRHVYRTLAALVIVAVTLGILWGEWGLRGSLGLSPSIDQSGSSPLVAPPPR
jgi:hypothetical protein